MLCQTVFETQYEDNACAAPYRYSAYTTTCLNGRTAIQCTGSRAYIKACPNCSSANETCTVDTEGTLVDVCSSKIKTTCVPPTPPQPFVGYISYVEYSKAGCGTTFSDLPRTYNQTKFDCVNNIESIQCTADKTGVLYTRWVSGSVCARVDYQKTVKFGDCLQIGQGSLYRKFTGCSTSDGSKAVGCMKSFVFTMCLLILFVIVNVC